MKILAVFSALFAVACANNLWTAQQLSEAIQSSHTDASLKPYLEAALNQMMSDLWAGQQVEAVTVSIPAMENTSLTLEQLSTALQNPATDPGLIPHLEAALNQLMEDLFSGKPVETAVVTAPGMDIHHYTLHELSEALQNPNTNDALIPYFEHALNKMMEALFAGEQMNPATDPGLIPHLEAALNQLMEDLFSGKPVEMIIIAVPAGLTPVVPEVIPSPVDTPVDSVVPDVPIAPEAPASPATPTTPLVQIILNINQQSTSLPAAPVVIPTEPIAADPVNVVDSAPITPVDVIDVSPVAVQPVDIIDVMPVVVPTEVVDISPAVVEPAPGSPVVAGTPSVHDI